MAHAGGRPKGSPNKRSKAIKERIEALGGDPILYLVRTMQNRIPCSVCRGKGRTKYQPGNSADPSNRTCQSCWGSKLEKITPKDGAWAAAELLQYTEAKRKAVELSGEIKADIAAEIMAQRFKKHGGDK